MLELKLQSRHQVKAWFPEYHGNNAKNGTMLEYDDFATNFLAFMGRSGTIFPGQIYKNISRA